MASHQLILGDCLKAMADLPACSVDAVVCDPPYGLGFMGKAWDTFTERGQSLAQTGRGRGKARGGDGSPSPSMCAGNYDRSHRANRAFGEWCQSWAVEAFRILKPGGHLVSFSSTRTAHRMATGIEDAGFDIRDTISWLYWSGFPKSFDVAKGIDKAAGAEREVVGEISKIDSYGSHTGSIYGGRPDHGGVMKITAPATDEAKTWNGWGTALKPASEPAILARKPLEGTVAANVLKWGTGGLNVDGCRMAHGDPAWPGPQDDGAERWPANIYHCAKPSRSEREAGCGHLPNPNGIHNIHPTVKPIQIMAWLCRLVTPPGGVVLDPFMGSGTTGIAAIRQGFDFIGIERDSRYLEIARARIEEDAPLFNRVKAV